ncbi:MaoC/PaaZ C-terminal domain-containing protein [Pueribacillus sp. YX66]|uniref:MaoC/PaaZ C-terminal domain-containing protein n=1 Tax=Pueribacillus sp. YX66 TaxID=3229242 RepID=UPI00358D8056
MGIYTLTELFVGQIARIQRTFTDEDVKLYSTLTREFNQVYKREEAVWESHFEGPIVPGLLSEGLIIEVISKKLPGTACVLLQKEIIYSHPIYIGDTISAELQIIDINHQRNWITQKISCTNQHGKEVVKGQVVVFILPNKNNR